MPTPNTPAAGPGNLSAVWVDSARQMTALTYGAGSITVYMAPSDFTDPIGEFQEFIQQNGVGAISQADGQPALVIPPSTNAGSPSPAVVEFNRNGQDISLYSDTYPTDTLLGVANSMQ